MTTKIPTYLDKVYIIDDNFAVIRNPRNLESSLKYKAGDDIPHNSAVGKAKIIPLNTKVKVTDVKIGSNRNVYVFAVPIDAPDFIIPGWTRPSNLEGKFLNEIIGFKPADWDLEPVGDNYTVVDKQSLIRTGSPDYSLLKVREKIPVGTHVEINAKSRQSGRIGKYVRVSHLIVKDGQMVSGESIGWTSFANLGPKKSKELYTVVDNNSLLRTGNPGFKIIQPRVRIPVGTCVDITEEAKLRGKTYVHVRHITIEDGQMVPGESIGWTSFANLGSKKSKELYTVVDRNSLIRTGSPKFEFIESNSKIPTGTYVDITARSKESGKVGKYVRVRHMTIENGQMVPGDPIGWTSFNNLVAGNSKELIKPEWTNDKGDNAAWKKGKFIGVKALVSIVGTGGQLQHIVFETLQPYLELLAAAREDNITLSINSGFRTYAKQASLRKGWDERRPGFNLAAKPGRSNHQNGIAFDLNTGGFGWPVYNWMKKNATRFGFLRTVNNEHWHWEYNPIDAAIARKNKTFKTSRVRT